MKGVERLSVQEKKYIVVDTLDDPDDYLELTVEEIRDFIINFQYDNHSFDDDEWTEYQRKVFQAAEENDVDELDEFLLGFGYAIRF